MELAHFTKHLQALPEERQQKIVDAFTTALGEVIRLDLLLDQANDAGEASAILNGINTNEVSKRGYDLYPQLNHPERLNPIVTGLIIHSHNLSIAHNLMTGIYLGEEAEEWHKSQEAKKAKPTVITTNA